MNDWHSDFVTAIKEELKDEKVEIKQEEYLSKEPLRIDVIIIKKEKDVKINKRVGQIFKRYNIIEYKSPDDYVSIDDYFKGLGYVYLYKSIMNAYDKSRKEVDDIKIDELTLTFVCNNLPKKLISFLTEHKIKLDNSDSGVYYIDNEWIPVQIIVLSELENVEENYPLMVLSNNMHFRNAIEKVISSINEAKEYDNKIRLIEAAFRIDPGIVSEVIKMYADRLSEEQMKYVINNLKEANFKIYTEEELKKSMEKGMEKGIENLVIRLLKKKFDDVPEKYLRLIEDVDEKTLLQIADNIFEINKIEDLEKYIVN
ncbi:hypothetical protein Thexy_1811 [Thermoanaerobacterium xylanolyticum LX-11]|uniref:DUF4351 domain-containing protein n=1 Tax=Thermoanaerobacterium xylanolyticum (strain ATCC 49914 / DSM 7097 / LX-11) TaxID=858215 RepID=F6BIU6_THEXL|nr:DUF4351 domain-containing protein [Thermoanaerobacterium xylanolyticum]AEF17831.1 hypothetical protein Thexy_1811 [Thermoanaerobacterium xylanolyticum LX-11]